MISGWLGQRTGLKKTRHTHTTPFWPHFEGRTLADVERGLESAERADALDLAQSKVHRGSVRKHNVGEKRREPGHVSPRKNVWSYGRFAPTSQGPPRVTFRGRHDVCTGGPADVARTSAAADVSLAGI